MRLFLAIDLEKEHKQMLAQSCEALKNFMPELHWVKPNNYHITLKFIGDFPAENIAMLASRVRSVLRHHSVFSVRLGALILLQLEGKPKILACSIFPKNAITLLANEIEQVLQLCDVKVDFHLYKPHVTLARLQQDCSLAHVKWLAPNINCHVEKVTLFHSVARNNEESAYEAVTCLMLGP